MATGNDEMRYVNIGELKIKTKMREIFVKNTDIESTGKGISPGNSHDIFGKFTVSSVEKKYEYIGTFMLNQKTVKMTTDKQAYVKIGGLKIEEKSTEIYINSNESAEILPGKTSDVFDKRKTSCNIEDWVKIGKLMLELDVADMYDYEVRIDDPVALQARYNDHLRSREIYHIRSNPKGRVLLINNEFRGDILQRDGSEKDVKNMKHLWKQLDCEVTTKQNLSSTEICVAVQEFITETKDVDYCALFVMSHGGIGDMEVGNDDTPKDMEVGNDDTPKDMVVGNDGKQVSVKELVDYFRSDRCSHLDGKPKLLFFQMCRGNEGTDHTDESSEEIWLRNLLREALPEGKILGDPDEADKALNTEVNIQRGSAGQANASDSYTDGQTNIMVAFATSPGYVSFRNTRIGSWFIHAIAQEFSEMVAQYHVEEIMKKVKENVYGRRANRPGTIHHTQTALCDISNALAKSLYFYPGCQIRGFRNFCIN